MTRYCTHCGAPIADGAQFCMSCGAPAPTVTAVDAASAGATTIAAAQPQSAPATCPRCGAPLEADAQFCTVCGYRLGDSLNSAGSDTGTSASPANQGFDPLAYNPQPQNPAYNDPTATVATPPVSTPAPLPTATPAADAPLPPTVPPMEIPGVPSGPKKHTGAIVFGCIVAAAAVIGLVVVLVVKPFDAKPAVPTAGTGSSQDTTLNVTPSDQGSKDASKTDDSDSSTDASNSKKDETAATKSDVVGSTDSDYVLPQVTTHHYTAEELSGLSSWELKVARNEPFARHGREFQDSDLQNYFNSKSWYTPQYSPDTFDAMQSPLSQTEKDNVNTVISVQKARGDA